MTLFILQRLFLYAKEFEVEWEWDGAHNIYFRKSSHESIVGWNCAGEIQLET